MYFQRRANILFRDYGSFGYITDNRNFGYKQFNNTNNDIGDKIISQSGAVFFSVLSNNPQTLEELANKLSVLFLDVNINIIKSDAVEFYRLLETDGFIVSGETSQECLKKDIEFPYYSNCISTNKSSLLKNKLENSTQDFFESYFINNPQLLNIHLEITSKCNERCVHCYLPNENKTNSLSADLFYSIIEQCYKMHVFNITISGGEPMLHQNFLEFIKKCHDYNFSLNILSNLTLLNETILQEFKRNKLLSIQTSLYSMDPEIHDSITQKKGSFEKTKNAILTLIKNNIPLQISCPILKQNLSSYKNVVNWGNAHNINVNSDYVIIGQYNHTNQNLDNRISLNEAKHVVRQKIVDNPQYLQKLENDAEEKKNQKPEDYICNVCQSSICISENGEVYPCAGWQDYIVGNLSKDTLHDIWQESPKIKYLRNLRRKDFPECIHCTERQYCTMCLVRNANEDPKGDPLSVNKYFCELAKFDKSIVTKSDN